MPLGWEEELQETANRTSNGLSNAYLRRPLLEFFENTRPQPPGGLDRDELERRAAQDNRSIVKPPSPFDSWFEVDVALELLRKDFTVLAQYEVRHGWRSNAMAIIGTALIVTRPTWSANGN